MREVEKMKPELEKRIMNALKSAASAAYGEHSEEGDWLDVDVLINHDGEVITREYYACPLPSPKIQGNWLLLATIKNWSDSHMGIAPDENDNIDTMIEKAMNWISTRKSS